MLRTERSINFKICLTKVLLSDVYDTVGGIFDSGILVLGIVEDDDAYFSVADFVACNILIAVP